MRSEKGQARSTEEASEGKAASKRVRKRKGSMKGKENAQQLLMTQRGQAR